MAGALVRKVWKSAATLLTLPSPGRALKPPFTVRISPTSHATTMKATPSSSVEGRPNGKLTRPTQLVLIIPLEGGSSS